LSHKGDYSKCQFCPKCGVKSLEFDRYQESSKKGIRNAEFICLTCGFGFRIEASARVQAANTLFRRHRAMRDGKFECGVSPEAAKEWVKFQEGRQERWKQRVERRGTSL